METLLNDSTFWLIAFLLCTALIGVWRVIAMTKQIPSGPVEQILEQGKDYAQEQYLELKAKEELAKQKALEINLEPAPTVAVVAIPEIENPAPMDVSTEEKPKRKRGFNSGALVLLGIIFLSGCVPGLWTKENVEEGIELVKYFTTDRDSAKVKKPVDSIVVRFNPVYLKTQPYSGNSEIEREWIQAGYRVWELETPSFRRTEIQKLDSIIYIYKK